MKLHGKNVENGQETAGGADVLDEGPREGVTGLPLHRLEAGAPRQLGERLAALAQQADGDGRPVFGPFLEEEECRLARLLFDGQDGLRVRFYGGYRLARRRRVVIVPGDVMEGASPAAALAALWVRRQDDGDGTGSGGAAASKGEPPPHDVLSALRFEADDVGDVLTAAEGGWQAVVSREKAAALWGGDAEPSEGGEGFLPDDPLVTADAVVSAAGRDWLVRCIEFERLDAPPSAVKEIRTTVSSLRLDAVGGSGFGISRSKMTDAIKAGRVRLNWQVVTAPSRPVKEGDVISVPGRGKLVVGAVGSPTRKRRLPVAIQYVRYN